jgi:hypothetical protein
MTSSGTTPSAPLTSGTHTTDAKERRQGVPVDSAHPSALAERLTVVSFRPVGGACL